MALGARGVKVFKGGRLTASARATGLGRDFGRLVAYLLGGRGAPDPDRVAWHSYRRLDAVDGPLAAAQVMRAAGEHPRVQCPVYHCGLSVRPGEHLEQAQWDQAVDLLLHRLGLAGHQALIVAHRDTAHEHVHVVVNRVGDDGGVWRSCLDLRKAQIALRRIESELGLAPHVAPDLLHTEAHLRRLPQTRHGGRQPLGDRVREQAATAFAEAADWRDLERRLAVHGFRLAPGADVPAWWSPTAPATIPSPTSTPR